MHNINVQLGDKHEFEEDLDSASSQRNLGSVSIAFILQPSTGVLNGHVRLRSTILSIWRRSASKKHLKFGPQENTIFHHYNDELVNPG
jgi:hypothetical protein